MPITRSNIGAYMCIIFSQTKHSGFRKSSFDINGHLEIFVPVICHVITQSHARQAMMSVRAHVICELFSGRISTEFLHIFCSSLNSNLGAGTTSLMKWTWVSPISEGLNERHRGCARSVSWHILCWKTKNLQQISHMTGSCWEPDVSR